MNDTTRTPHVDPGWAEAFLLELRMLDVEGRRIGAALADVEAHCADSGESAGDAFGDPVAYARELGLPRRDGAFTLSEGAALAAGVVGMFVTTFAAGAWATREQVGLTLGLLLAVALLAAALGLLLRHPEAVMRALVARPWLLVAANVVVVAGCAGLLLAFDQAVVELPPVVVGTAGAALVAWHTVEGVRGRARGSDDDPVVGPEGPDGVGSLRVERRFRVLSALGPWVTAIATVVLVLLSLSLRLA